MSLFNRFTLALALIASAAASQAIVVNLFIDNPFPTIVKPNSGTTTYQFTGKIQVFGTATSANSSLDFIYLNGSNSQFLNIGISFPLGSLLGTNQTYTGDLFSVDISNTTTEGVYDHALNTVAAPQFRVTVQDTDNNFATAAGTYNVNVVPEPATLALLAIPAFVLKRKRK